MKMKATTVKEIQKSAHSLHMLPAKPVSAPSIETIFLLLVGFFGCTRLFISLKRRRWTTRFRPPFRDASDRQLAYLKVLISEQNFFRSKPVSWDEWRAKKAPKGFISSKYASDLIRSLKSENEALKTDFQNLKQKPNTGRFRKTITVSDLRAFQFCERASYYSTHQFPSQNLIDLSAGANIHDAYANETNRNSSRSANTELFIKRRENQVVHVEWVSNAANSFAHPRLPLSGKPDGFLHFRDGTRGVIELKTVPTLPEQARDIDFHQADVYALLVPPEMKIRDQSFVLYRERLRPKLALYKRRRSVTEYDLLQSISKIERGARSIGSLRVAQSESQCKACGYRAICPGGG